MAEFGAIAVAGYARSVYDRHTIDMLTIINMRAMLMIVNIHAMSKSINSATVGALVRQARLTAGLSQTDLGNRIGASRFWVAQFEKGKPSAELGLALKAIHALRLTVLIEAKDASQRAARLKTRPKTGQTNLAKVIAHATLPSSAPSSVVGWPSASAASRPSRKP
jgi:HTH-type transcriptional regulator / antitoxin HipB